MIEQETMKPGTRLTFHRFLLKFDFCSVWPAEEAHNSPNCAHAPLGYNSASNK
jgi:hypothetical protein